MNDTKMDDMSILQRKVAELVVRNEQLQAVLEKIRQAMRDLRQAQHHADSLITRAFNGEI